MVFSSLVFLLLFLPIVFCLNMLIPKRFSNSFLVLASLLFYAWGEPKLVLLMVLSIVFNYILGIVISISEVTWKKWALAAAVAINIGILGYFKYAAFLASIINQILGNKVLEVPERSLPIGISFFTFQAISYIVDVYRGDTEASRKVTNVALYISFFPQLIAGPIVKYRDINKQIENRHADWREISYGFKRFIYGLAKKVLIANVLGLCVDYIFDLNISTLDARTAWIGALAYVFQIYYDFSGYSDMAIGLGRMFGFTILENFNYPYLSHSITEFWRRWHISLGTWFREYVYIPLGGNKRGVKRTYTNLTVVFLLTGLWHGADFSFVIWGLYHGVFSLIERVGFKKSLEKHPILSVIYCQLVVCFGWVLFRASDTIFGGRYIARMLLPWRHKNLNIPYWEYLDGKTVFAFACAIVGMGGGKLLIPERLQNMWRDSVLEAFYCVGLLILCLASIASDTYNPFIYCKREIIRWVALSRKAC